jgi:hypothetical protein
METENKETYDFQEDEINIIECVLPHKMSQLASSLELYEVFTTAKSTGGANPQALGMK